MEKKTRIKAAHGFRKFYKSRAEQVMRPINVEITMGHNIGLSDCYYRPIEKEVVDDYIKAVDLLTINSDGITIKKQVQKLKEDNKNSEYIIKGKLQEKDEQINTLMKKQEQFELMIQALIDTGQLKPDISNQ